MKNFVLSLLVCANIALLTAVILRSTTPNIAFAQGVDLSGNYLMVTSEAHSDNDAIFILDTNEHMLYVITSERRGRDQINLLAGDSRNLDDDFRNLRRMEK